MSVWVRRFVVLGLFVPDVFVLADVVRRTFLRANIGGEPSPGRSPSPRESP
ncbi:hypothetical protein ABN028_00605 [Actinopolymorpha sp. B17G11]|uniref:hypothetical protein n=1 Tax=Actinopolymorpha sp. B17G11 TaxID=3160861 RepID=UPI0032E3C09B